MEKYISEFSKLIKSLPDELLFMAYMVSLISSTVINFRCNDTSMLGGKVDPKGESPGKGEIVLAILEPTEIK